MTNLYQYSGIVYDSTTHNPIPGVNLSSGNENSLVITDSSGSYKVSLDQASYDISKDGLFLNKLGYNTFSYIGPVNVDDNGIITLPTDFYLDPEVQPTPDQIEKQRADDQRQRILNTEATSKIVPNSTDISNSTATSQKPTGTAALQNQALKQGKILLLTLLPAVIALASQAGLKTLNSVTPKVPDVCPTDSLLQELIKKRNDIVDMLNKVATSLNITVAALTGVSITYDVISAIFTTIGAALPVAKTGIALVPSPPGTPGILITSLLDLKDILKDNQPKLDSLKSVIDGTSLALSLVSLTIVVIIGILKALDGFLGKCQLNANLTPIATSLTPIATSLITIAEQQAKASQTSEQIEYKGFVIKIVTVPYTPTVNRQKAVGYNSDGIQIIETELSFTTNQQTLIDELKQNIDINNLKAN